MYLQCDGQLLATGSYDGYARIWNTEGIILLLISSLTDGREMQIVVIEDKTDDADNGSKKGCFLHYMAEIIT